MEALWLEQSHQPVCTFVHTLMNPELTQHLHPGWAAGSSPSLRSGVVQARLVQDTGTGHGDTAFPRNCCLLRLGMAQSATGAHSVGPGGCSTSRGGVWCHLVSAFQDQQDGEHTEGGEGKPQAPLLQLQAALHSRLLQEVT